MNEVKTSKFVTSALLFDRVSLTICFASKQYPGGGYKLRFTAYTLIRNKLVI